MPATALEHALTLIARMHDGNGPRAAAAQAELAAWRREAPVHEAAVRDADALWRAVGGAAAALRGELPEPPPQKAAPRKRAKGIARTGAVLGLAFVLAFVVRWWLTQTVLERQYATGTAQIAHAKLPDASRRGVDARTSAGARFAVGAAAPLVPTPRPSETICPVRRSPFVYSI